MSTDYDLIIIGAGAAGLSFLLALNERAYQGRVLILESQPSFNVNKTWSFWLQDDMPYYLQKIIKHQWASWRLTHSGQSVIHDCRAQAYSCIDASDFFDLASQVVSNNDGFTLEFNKQVDSVEQKGNIAMLRAGERRYSAKAVIDTRTTSTKAPYNALFQCFYGLEISTDTNCFNEHQALIMDELVHGKLGIEFLYVLPFSPTHALVEYTCFNTSVVSSSVLKEKAEASLAGLIDNHDFTIIRSESGTLPMFNIADESTPSDNIIIKAGIGGGAMRASTGYCFQPIQRWASELADKFCATQKLCIVKPITPLYRWLDDIFLSVMTQNTDKGPSILFRFANEMDAPAFARFMSEKATKKDLLKAIMSMPKAVFIKGMFRHIFASKKSEN